MGFGGENEHVQIENNITWISKDQIQIFEGLGEYERVHSIFMLSGSNIVDSRKSAGDTGMFLQCLQHLFGHLLEGKIVLDRQIEAVTKGLY